MKRLLSRLAVGMVLVLTAASSPSATPTASSAWSTERVDTALEPTSTPVPLGQPLPDRRESTPQGDGSSAGALTAGAARPSAAAPSQVVRPREPAVALPRQIRIPAIGVDAPFEFVGLTADGAMDVPKDPAKVAWYQLGPRPGELGNAVIAGHVDWGGKAAVFWDLGKLQEGDIIEIVAADDRKYQFAVQWQRWYDSAAASVEEVFGQSEAREVTLITCGGIFDRQIHQYKSRLVVRGLLR